MKNHQSSPAHSPKLFHCPLISAGVEKNERKSVPVDEVFLDLEWFDAAPRKWRMSRRSCYFSKDGGISRTKSWEDGIAAIEFIKLVWQISRSILRFSGRVAVRRNWDGGGSAVRMSS